MNTAPGVCVCGVCVSPLLQVCVCVCVVCGCVCVWVCVCVCVSTAPGGVCTWMGSNVENKIFTAG